MLQDFGTDLRIAEGPELQVMGFPYPTRMAVIRLKDGGLFLWSPVAPEPALLAELRAAGPVRHIVAPNALHDTYLAPWAEAFPEARLHAAPGLREKRPDLSFDAELSADPDPGWAGQIDQVPVPNRIATEVVFFHRASGTVLFTDLLQQFPAARYRGWRRLVARLDLMTEPEPTVPRKFRLACTDRQAVRAAVRQVLDWPAERVLMAHGTPVTSDARAFLRRAFGWLKP